MPSGTGTKRRWNEADKEYVRQNYGTIPVRQIAHHLNRSEDSIRQLASAENITKDPGDTWTREDLLYLQKNFRRMKVNDIAVKLGRTHRAVAHKITDLELANSMLPQVDTSPLEKGIPYFDGKHAQYRALLLAMEVGVSFEYPIEDRQTIQNCMLYFRDRLYKTKRQDEKTRRIWRLL